MTDQSLALAVASGLAGHQGGRISIPGLLNCQGAAPVLDPLVPQSLTSVGMFVRLEPEFDGSQGHDVPDRDINDYPTLKRLLSSKRDRRS